MDVNHYFIPVTFRLNAWKGVKGTQNSIFNEARVQLDMDKILAHVYERLADTKYGVLKKELFSLVNIYNPITSHSVGYLSAPPKEVVKPNVGLVLTFSLTARPVKNPPTDPFINRIAEELHFWGKDILNLTDYLSINITRDFLRSIQSSHRYKDDLLYYYNVIGIGTKNWVKYPIPLNRDLITTVPIGLLNSKYFDKGLPDTFKKVGQESWQFVAKVWEDCSNLLNDHHFSGSFPLYFCLYLYDKFGNNLGRPATHFIYGQGQGTLQYFVEAGIRRLNQMLRSTSTSGDVEDDLYAAVHLILVLLEDEGGLGGADNDREAWDFINLLRRYIDDEDTDNSILYNYLSQTQRVARSLINQKDDEPFIHFLEDNL